MTTPVDEQPTPQERRKKRFSIAVLAFGLAGFIVIVSAIVSAQMRLAHTGPSGTLIFHIESIPADQSFPLSVVIREKNDDDAWFWISTVQSHFNYMTPVTEYTTSVTVFAHVSGFFGTDGVRCEITWLPDGGRPKEEFVQRSLLGQEEPDGQGIRMSITPKCEWTR